MKLTVFEQKSINLLFLRVTWFDFERGVTQAERARFTR
jgi:hypothetical protein